jgi:hypothetical protein
VEIDRDLREADRRRREAERSRNDAGIERRDADQAREAAEGAKAEAEQARAAAEEARRELEHARRLEAEARSRLQLLLEAGGAMSASLEVRPVLSALTGAAARRICDYSIAFVAGPDGRVVDAVGAHRDRRGSAWSSAWPWHGFRIRTIPRALRRGCSRPASRS